MLICGLELIFSILRNVFFFFFNVKQWLEFCNYRSQVQLNLLHISNKNAQKCAFVCFFFLKNITNITLTPLLLID